MNLENLGNVPESYIHKPRYVSFLGLITEPNLVLKLYSMLERIRDKECIAVDDDMTKSFLTYRIRNGEIEPFIGLGFAILSEDMLNVARWDTTYPIVLKNQIYEHEDCRLVGEKIHQASLLDTREIGSFCAWELGVVNHERLAWLKYLNSRRSEEEKDRYLISVLDDVYL